MKMNQFAMKKYLFYGWWLHRKLIREQLGEIIGVQKSQISKLERNTKNVTIETILKVFNALKANVKFSVEMEESEFKVA